MTRRRRDAKKTSRPVSGQSASGSKPSVPLFPKRVLLSLAVLIAATVAVYAPVRHFGFVWDDPDYVTENVHVGQGLTWQGVQWALTSTDAANWHPATWLSHMIDVQLYGRNAGPQHVTNLVLHILNALLLFGLLHRMTGAWGRSTFVAGLFALHPLHVESVAWISERKDVLSTLFWMLTMWAYVGYARRPGLRRYLLVVLWFGLGLMAKPMLVTLPFVLLLTDFWPLGRMEGVARLVKEKIPLFAMAAISSGITVVAQRQGGAVAGLWRVPMGVRLLNAPASCLAYIGKMLWPVRLSAFYPLDAATPVLQAALGALLLIGVTVLAIRAGRRHGYVLTGWLWYLGTLVPVIGLVQVGGQSMADRYTYVPLIGLFVILAWGAAELAGRWRYGRTALPVAAACLLAACAVLARAQAAYWSDGATLWQHALEVTEHNYVAHANLGGILLKQGKTDEAIAHFVAAQRIKPDLAEAQADLGMAYLSQGKFDEAAQRFAAALRIDPNYVEAHATLGNALARQGKVDEAIGEYKEALRLRPAYAEAHNDLGVALGLEGKLDEAAQQLAEAIRINPDFAEAHDNLGNALAGQGKMDEAIGQFREALRLNPGYAEAHNDLGVALGRQGKLDEAVQHFTTALRIKPDFVDASDNLKLARDMQGKGGQ